MISIGYCTNNKGNEMIKDAFDILSDHDFLGRKEEVWDFVKKELLLPALATQDGIQLDYDLWKRWNRHAVYFNQHGLDCSLADIRNHFLHHRRLGPVTVHWLREDVVAKLTQIYGAADRVKLHKILSSPEALNPLNVSFPRPKPSAKTGQQAMKKMIWLIKLHNLQAQHKATVEKMTALQAEQQDIWDQISVLHAEG